MSKKIGCIPIGGKATRLSMPFSKEMLPQYGYDYYNPISNLTVTNMEKAGATDIYFVHGHKYKQDVMDFFNKDTHHHIKQETLGFANVLYDLMIQVKPDKNTEILFGLPDSYYKDNPYNILSGSQCGLFETANNAMCVDRSTSGNKFDIKNQKTENNDSWFWGALSLTTDDMYNAIDKNYFKIYSEVGDILNNINVTTIRVNDTYIDIGTWVGYNEWIKKAT
jgi:hypothetical protein